MRVNPTSKQQLKMRLNSPNKFAPSDRGVHLKRNNNGIYGYHTDSDQNEKNMQIDLVMVGNSITKVQDFDIRIV